MSGNALLDQFVAERDGLLNTVEVLQRNAAERGLAGGKPDLSDEDAEVVQRSKARIAAIDKQIALVGDNLAMDEDTANKLRMARGEKPITDVAKYRSAGHLLWDTIHAQFGSAQSMDDRDAKDRYDRLMKRAAEHMGTDAALTTPTAGGFGGLTVAPIVGPVINLSPRTQPFLTAIGKRPAPNALTFLRPRVVDPDFATGVAKQTLQKAELASKKFDLKNDSVSLDTYGGYLNVSQQLLSLTPESLNIIIAQLQRRTAWQGELAAVTELDDSTAQVNLASNVTDPSVILKALYDAAALVLANTQEMPEWLLMGSSAWARLGALVDDVKRPIFPFLMGTNAVGVGSLTDQENPLGGLRVIVTPAITDGDMWMGNSMALEAYSYSFPVLEAVEPSNFGRQVAVAEALAFWRPTTGEGDPLEGDGAVKIAPAGS